MHGNSNSKPWFINSFRGKNIWFFISLEITSFCAMCMAWQEQTVSLNQLSVYFYHFVANKFNDCSSQCQIMLCIGQHCCLWCAIQLAQLKVTSSDGSSIPRWTLASIAKNHTEFLASGGNLKKVKEYNNALHLPFLHIPLTQVNMTEICHNMHGMTTEWYTAFMWQQGNL